MTFTAESQKIIEEYLVALRKQLRELIDDDVNDIVEEIRFHIVDKSSDDASPEIVLATLTALGTPEELAGRYRTDELMRRAQSSRSPVTRLQSLFHWATLSMAGVIVFAISVIGYCLGGGLVIAGVLKILNPHNTGLWKTHYPDGSWSLGAGSGSQPGHGKELLGWWLVPIGLILGSVLLLLTFQFGDWCLRRFWRPRVPRSA